MTSWHLLILCLRTMVPEAISIDKNCKILQKTTYHYHGHLGNIQLDNTDYLKSAPESECPQTKQAEWDTYTYFNWYPHASKSLQDPQIIH